MQLQWNGNEMPWSSIKCNGMHWNALEQNGVQRNALECNEVQLNAMQCIGMECNSMQCKETPDEENRVNGKLSKGAMPFDNLLNDLERKTVWDPA